MPHEPHGGDCGCTAVCMCEPVSVTIYADDTHRDAKFAYLHWTWNLNSSGDPYDNVIAILEQGIARMRLEKEKRDAVSKSA